MDPAEEFVSRRLALRHLRVLNALCRHRSVQRAADVLCVTQPAVSKTLAEIEEGVGQPVFERRGRELIPTPAGALLLDLAHRMCSQLSRTGEEMRALSSGHEGCVVVGATNVALATLLPEAIASLKRSRPNVTIRVVIDPLSRMLEELQSGAIDLVAARIPTDVGVDNLTSAPLFNCADALVCRVDHPATKLPSLSWADVAAFGWIVPCQNTLSRARLQHVWHDHGIGTPNNLVESEDLMLNLQLLQKSLFIAVTSRRAALQEAAAGRLAILPLDVDLGLGEVRLWQRNGPLRPVAEVVRMTFLAAAGGDRKTAPREVDALPA